MSTHTCQYLVPGEGGNPDTECGQPAVKQVTVRNKIDLVKVHICDLHKRRRNFNAANLRNPAGIKNCTIPNCKTPEHNHLPS